LEIAEIQRENSSRPDSRKKENAKRRGPCITNKIQERWEVGALSKKNTTEKRRNIKGGEKTRRMLEKEKKFFPFGNKIGSQYATLGVRRGDLSQINQALV